MAYSDIENRFLNALAELQFPTATPQEMAAEEPSLEGVQLAAGPSSTRTDAPAGAGMGEIKPIPRNPLQEVIGKLGDAIQSGAEKIDFDVIGLPGVGSLTLKDLTVGDIGKVLQDISYGFYPVRGGNEATGGIGTFGLKPDPALELLNAAPAVGAAGKAAVKGAKAAGKALAPKAGEMLENYLTKTGAILKMAPDSPGIEVPAAPKPSTPAFKKWFADSKVVDDKGQPLVVYHGTDQSFDEFRGNAYFTPMPEDASKYSYVNTPGKEHSPNVVPVYLSLQKPKTIKTYATRADIDDAKAAGFDGVIVQGVGGSKINHYIVFESTQIKSLFNKGTFDPKDPRILHGGSAAATGAAAQGEENK